MVRIFWIAVAVLVAATAAVFLRPASDGPVYETQPTNATTPPAPSPSPTAVSPTPSPTDDPTPDHPPSEQPETIAPADDENKPDQERTAAPKEPNTNTPDTQQPQTQTPIANTTNAADATNTFNPSTNMPRPEDAPPQTPGSPTEPGVPVTAPAAESTDAPSSMPAADATAERAEDEDTAEPQPQADQSPANPADETKEEQADQPTDQPEESAAENDAVHTPPPAKGIVGAVVDPIIDALTPPPVAVTPRQKPAQPADQRPAATPVVQTPTGLLLDGRWKVDGKGTKASPYTIEWEMLVALQREYQPRLGQTEIPEWINALNGKTVTIRGYALLPMGMSSLSELLVMLNQWDSCCIGVPPTPFDAIEVRLAENLSNSAQSMFSHTGALSFGDITGTFKIDPYIVQGYLLGLYLMEDATANLLGPAGTP